LEVSSCPIYRQQCKYYFNRFQHSQYVTSIMYMIYYRLEVGQNHALNDFCRAPTTLAGQTCGDSLSPVLGAVLYDLSGIRTAYVTQTAIFCISLAALMLLGVLWKATRRREQLPKLLELQQEPKLPAPPQQQQLQRDVRFQQQLEVAAGVVLSPPPACAGEFNESHSPIAEQRRSTATCNQPLPDMPLKPSPQQPGVQAETSESGLAETLIGKAGSPCPENKDLTRAASDSPLLGATQADGVGHIGQSQDRGAVQRRRSIGSCSSNKRWPEEQASLACRVDTSITTAAQQSSGLAPDAAAVTVISGVLEGADCIITRNSTTGSDAGSAAANVPESVTSVWAMLKQRFVICECSLAFFAQMLRAAIDVLTPIAMYTTATWVVGMVFLGEAAGAVLAPFVFEGIF
jgi:hypothetical protein